MSQTKHIEVVPYDVHWPHIFECEAVKIKEILKDQYLAVHHVGSTSVFGLSAKPIIDIIAVVKNPEACMPFFKSLGFTYKGEFNIPLHYGFSKKDNMSVNLHVYPEDHPEINLNLMFRDYLRSYPEALREYAALKNTLLQDPQSFEKNNSLFTGYNLGKNSFIRKTLKEAGFNRKRIVKCTHYSEWEAAKAFRQKNFFDKMGMNDLYTWTLTHPDHVHLIFYKGVDVVGYAHIQF